MINLEKKMAWQASVLEEAKKDLLSNRKEIKIGLKPINVEKIVLPNGTEIPEGIVLEVVSIKDSDKIKVDGGEYGIFEVEKNKLGMPI